MSEEITVAPTPDHAEFWAWCRRGELRVQRCTDCGALRFHPRPRCPVCRSAGFEWVRCSGRGTVFTYTICHPPVLAAFADRVPYNAAVIELAEGPLMVSNIVDCGNDDIHVGMHVEVVFVERGGMVLPQFRPLSPSGFGRVHNPASDPNTDSEE
jgi:uncharacterized OB-fold protein